MYVLGRDEMLVWIVFVIVNLVIWKFICADVFLDCVLETNHLTQRG